jgi:hypothetical protein
MRVRMLPPQAFKTVSRVNLTRQCLYSTAVFTLALRLAGASAPLQFYVATFAPPPPTPSLSSDNAVTAACFAMAFAVVLFHCTNASAPMLVHKLCHEMMIFTSCCLLKL